jgi:ATP citrate (pro-S)-lyase
MSAKAIREYHGKKLTSRCLSAYSDGAKFDIEDRALQITPCALRPEDPKSFEALALENPWVLDNRLVVKPDQLIKRRGKAGLLAINKTWTEVVAWIKERMNQECKVEVVTGILDTFIVEPFVPHAQSDEYYICLQVRRVKGVEGPGKHSLNSNGCLFL